MYREYVMRRVLLKKIYILRLVIQFNIAISGNITLFDVIRIKCANLSKCENVFKIEYELIQFMYKLCKNTYHMKIISVL